jgi:hypothetical protein
MHQLEDKILQPGRIDGIRRGLDQARGGNAVGKEAAQFASRWACRAPSDATPAAIAGYLRVQSSPVRVKSSTAPVPRAQVRHPFDQRTLKIKDQQKAIHRDKLCGAAVCSATIV